MKRGGWRGGDVGKKKREEKRREGGTERNRRPFSLTRVRQSASMRPERVGLICLVAPDLIALHYASLCRRQTQRPGQCHDVLSSYTPLLLALFLSFSPAKRTFLTTPCCKKAALKQHTETGRPSVPSDVVLFALPGVNRNNTHDVVPRADDDSTILACRGEEFKIQGAELKDPVPSPASPSSFMYPCRSTMSLIYQRSSNLQMLRDGA